MSFSEIPLGLTTGIVSDRIPVRHFFTRKITGEGENIYFDRGGVEQMDAPGARHVRMAFEDLRDAGGFPVEGFCMTYQVHGTCVRYVTEADRAMPPLFFLPPACDALVTDRPNVPLMVFGADCLPVLFCDPEAGIIAAAHCGWKGSVKDMTGAVVRAMQELGAEPGRILVAIGPGISGCCFETGPEVREAVESLLGADAEGVCPEEPGVPGKYMTDLKEANRRRLLQLGLRSENIEVSEECTMCRTDLYWSHRGHHGRRGTQAGIIMLREEDL